jgi:hypothetical protein
MEIFEFHSYNILICKSKNGPQKECFILNYLVN